MKVPTGMFGKTPTALQECRSARTWLAGLPANGCFRQLGRTVAGFGELGGDFHGLRRVAPTRCLAAVTPGARAIEGMYAEFVHFLHLMHPRRPHPISVVVRRLGDFRQPELAVQ